MKYSGNSDLALSYDVKISRPLDTRSVQELKSDLLDTTKFGGSILQDYRYEGMLVTVVDDTDDNNGVYLLKDISHKNDESGWQKLLDLPKTSEFNDGDEIALKKRANGTFEWSKITAGSGSGVDKLEDLTDVDVTGVQNGQVLSWDQTQQKWVAVTPTSGGSGVTTQDIDYSMLFESTSTGGLGYTERGTNGTGMGWLKKTETWDGDNQSHNCLIPQGTSYQQIFEKILVGDATATASADNYSATYSGQAQSYITTLIHKPSSWTISGYGSSPNGPWNSNPPQRTDVGTTTFYIKLIDGNNQQHIIDNVKLTINKKSVTVKPVLQSNPIDLGQAITFSSNSPSYVGIVSGQSISISEFSGNKYQMNNVEYTENSQINVIGDQTIKISDSLKNYLNNNYSNYNFVQGSVTLTVNPIIQYKTKEDNDWMNYITTLSGFTPYTLITLDFPGLTVTTEGYMIPFIHTTAVPFRLRIKRPYKLDTVNMLYFDASTNTWKPKLSTQYSGFGTPTSSSDWNEYTYNGAESTNPLAIKIIPE